jgi:hypothetical protein
MKDTIQRLIKIGIGLSLAMGAAILLGTQVYWLHVAWGVAALSLTALCIMRVAMVIGQFVMARRHIEFSGSV